MYSGKSLCLNSVSKKVLLCRVRGQVIVQVFYQRVHSRDTQLIKRGRSVSLLDKYDENIIKMKY